MYFYMEPALGIVFIVLLLALAGLLVWSVVISYSGREKTVSLQQQLELLRIAQDGAKDTIHKSLLDNQANLSSSLQSNVETLNRLHGQIGQVLTASSQMQKVGDEVRRLQDILSSPKLRGQIGEWSLENLLRSILPADSYRLQHSFKDGKMVDALIRLSDYSVPVDAKFPLPAFERLAAASGDDERARERKQFLNDVIKHIDKIALQYIKPAEGTVDFALMFIPAENVYYETIIKHSADSKDILQYALDKKVIAVSPNLLYVYLMTVVMGLHGLQIEKQAAEIRQNLKKLDVDFAGFVSCWDTLGKHLRNAYSQHEEGQKKLDRFGMQLGQIQVKE